MFSVGIDCSAWILRGYSIMGINHKLFIHSVIDGHLNSFQVWAIMNHTVLNILMWCTFVCISVGSAPINEFLGHGDASASVSVINLTKWLCQLALHLEAREHLILQILASAMYFPLLSS